MGQLNPGGLQPIDQLGAKHLRKVPAIEEVAPGELAPLSSPHIDPTAGNDDMQMRVIVEPTAVGMQYRAEAELGLQLSMVATKRLECRCARLEQCVVDLHGLPHCQCPQPFRQREGGHVVVDRDELGLLPRQPVGRSLMLAARTTTLPQEGRPQVRGQCSR